MEAASLDVFSSEPGARVQLVNGRFVDVRSGRYYAPGASLVLAGGKIESMPGLAGQPADAGADFVVDLGGRAVIPGLFNTHTHIQVTLPSLVPTLGDMRKSHKLKEQLIERRMADCLAHGVTHIRDASPFEMPLSTNRRLRERITRGEIPGPRISQVVGVCQPGGYLATDVGLAIRLLGRFMGGWVADFDSPESSVVVFPLDAGEQQVRDAVDRAIDERGADHIKLGEQPWHRTNLKSTATFATFEQLAAVADQARRRGVRTTMHQVTRESFRRAVRAGISSLAHTPRDGPLGDDDVRLFMDSDCMLEPTISVMYAASWQTQGSPWHDHPLLKRLTQYRQRTFPSLLDEYWTAELRPNVTRGLNKLTRGRTRLFGLFDMSRLFKTYACVATHGVENVRRLYEHGAASRLSCGNDGGIPPLLDAMVRLELAAIDYCVRGEFADTSTGDCNGKGLSGAEALRIATLNSAKSLGLEDESGSIEPGKTADLVVLDGDPLEDFTRIGSRVDALFLGGRLMVNECGLEVRPLSLQRQWRVPPGED